MRNRLFYLRNNSINYESVNDVMYLQNTVYEFCRLRLCLINSSSITQKVGQNKIKQVKKTSIVFHAVHLLGALNSHTVNAMLGQNLICLEQNAEETKTTPFTDI